MNLIRFVFRKQNIIGVLSLLSCLALIGSSSGLANQTGDFLKAKDAQSSFTIGESIDFATRILRDAWDMSEFSDISQWLNHNGAENYLQDIQVQDGLFSARTSSTSSNFFALFSGYPPGVYTGKIGRQHPISSSAFGCFYMAMNAQTGGATGFQFTWADENLPFSVYGTNYELSLTDGVWTLYQVNMHTWPYYVGTPWWGRSVWQSLMIVPSFLANTTFSIDWIRLTDCQPVFVNLTGLPQGTYAIWVGTGSPERQILAQPSFSPQSNGSYDWDVQGLAAGSYAYYVKTLGGNPVQQGQVNIIASPVATFTSPSPVSGQDYASGQGNPWDMDPSDAPDIRCTSFSFTNGILILDTPPPYPGCEGPGANEADPIIFLNTPDHGDLSSFRYLSLSSSTTGYPWSVPDLGMIVRLFWRLDRQSGADCWYTSRAVALDIGWHTYVVDLYDPWNGTPEGVTPGDCPLVSWRNQALVGPLVGFRLDPNENILNTTLHQEIDWIRLTRLSRALQGQPFEAGLWLNKPVSDLVSTTFYYTDDLSNFTQHLAQTYNPPVFGGPFQTFLPFALSIAPNLPPPSLPPADLVFVWDTTGVTPGEYYLCAQVNDGYSQPIYCSEAPMQVTTP